MLLANTYRALTTSIVLYQGPSLYNSPKGKIHLDFLSLPTSLPSFPKITQYSL